MTDDIRRRGLLCNLAGRLQALEYDALRVVDRVIARLELGRERYGDLDLAQPRPWRRERNEELLDAIVYEVAGELAAEDAVRAELHERARTEMLGERPVSMPVTEERRREALQLIGPEVRAVPPEVLDERARLLGPTSLASLGVLAADLQPTEPDGDAASEFAADQHRTRIGGPEPYESLELEGPEYDFEGGGA